MDEYDALTTDGIAPLRRREAKSMARELAGPRVASISDWAHPETTRRRC